MNYLRDLWAKEPARVAAVGIVIVNAGLAVAVAYGLNVPAEVKTQVDLVGGSIITLLGAGVLIRSQVTPTAKP